MAKRKNQTTAKGMLDINWDEGNATITTIIKDVEYKYDFFKMLEEFNGKNVSFNIYEDIDLPTIDEE